MEEDQQQPAPEQVEPKPTTPKSDEMPVPKREQVMEFFYRIARRTKD